MQRVTQFCVGMKDEPGSLAKLCAALRDEGVNIEALFATDDDDGTWVNMVATPTDLAERVLGERGYHFFQEIVLTLSGAHRPGELERLSSRLAEAGVNINYVYGAGTEGRFSLVFNVSDLDKAENALGS